MPPLLALKNGSVHYGGVAALTDVSLEISAGEIVAIMGPNGAGKSTALKALVGLAPLSHGSVVANGKTIHPHPASMSAHGVSFVPQGRRVFPHLTVEENIELGGLHLPHAVRQERMDEQLRFFPALSPKRKRPAGILSGGQQQMVALARGLMCRPELLLLDEPSLGLAPKIVKEVFEKIQQINHEHKTAILIVEHNLKSLFSIIERAYILDKGQLIKEGSAAELQSTSLLAHVFLGAAHS